MIRRAAKRSPPSPQPRAAPLQARARERYDRILAATHAEIGETGLDALTMFGIARQARITPTSIYRYFESVEQILVSIASRALGDLEAQIRQLVDSARSTDEWIEAFAAATRLSWREFSTNSAARGLFSASKFLTPLRAIDDGLNQRVVDLMCRRFGQLTRQSDVASVRRVLTLAIGLSTPTFDLAMRQPRNARGAFVEEFIELTTKRLTTIIVG